MRMGERVRSVTRFCSGTAPARGSSWLPIGVPPPSLSQ